MADNKTYTLESAKELFSGDNWDATIDKMSLEEMMSLDKAIYGQPIAEGVADEAAYVREEAQKRIESLLEKDLAPDELDSIAAFVEQFASHSINGESVYVNDAAKALMAKVEKQKDELAAAAQQNQSTTENSADPITIDENAGDEQTLENQTQNDTAENTTQPQADEFVLGDESNAPSTLYEINEETGEITYLDDEGNPLTQETQEEEKTTEENAQDNLEEDVKFPEGQPKEELTDEEYAEMLDPLSQDMPEMTDEEKKRQAERLEKVDELSDNVEYQPEYLPEERDDEFDPIPEDAPVYDALKFSVEQCAIRKLTVSTDEINEENLKKARAEEEERITIEYYNAVFGACKTSEELDKETPKEHVERLGKIADLISQKKPKAEIYAAMGVNPSKDQEQIAANAVYRTNAQAIKDWAKNLGKSGLKMMDKYREFEKKNPQVALGLGLGMAGNPIYMGARMALSARGLYKDYQEYKKNHPNEKNSFLGMLKDKDARKNLMANANIFIRSIPVVGQAYGTYGMAKKLKDTCKKSFWKDLGDKFKDAGNSLKEVVKNPKDKSKWKDAWNKVGKPVAIVGGLAVMAYAAYKMVDAHAAAPVDDKSNETQPEPKENPENGADRPLTEEEKAALKEGLSKLGLGDKDQDGKIDLLDRDHGEGWANYTTQVGRAFDADPAGINEEMQKINPDWKWHSSAELKEMWEKTPQDGGFTDEQMKAISAHANSHFDEKGHIIDPELKEYYNNLNRAPAIHVQGPPAAPLEKIEDIAPAKLDLNVKVEVPEHLEIKTPEPVRDEQFYQDQKDALKPKGSESLKDSMQDARIDENVTVEQAIDNHMDNQVARGEMSSQQGEELGNVVKDQVGILDGKEDEDITKKDINHAVKETGKIMESMKENADEVLVSQNLEFSEELNYARDHIPENPPAGYAQESNNSEFYKGLETKTEEMRDAVRHGDNPSTVMKSALLNGELSEEQATAANLRYAELTGEGKSPEQALKTMADDYKKSGQYWSAQEKAATLQNANAHTADNANTDTNPGTTAKAATNDGTTTTTPSAKADDKTSTNTNSGAAATVTNTVDMGRHHSADSTTADKTPTLSERLSQLSGRSTPSPVAPELKGSPDHIPSKEEVMGKTLSLSQINGGR